MYLSRGGTVSGNKTKKERNAKAGGGQWGRRERKTNDCDVAFWGKVPTVDFWAL